MRGLTSRVVTNLVWLVLAAVLVTTGALVRFVGPSVFGDTYRLTVTIPEGGGVLPGMPVTVLGTQVGTIADTTVTREAVEVGMQFDRARSVPRSVLVQVLRRSPIGEQTIELTPVPHDWDPPADVTPSRAPIADGWEPAEPGSHLDPVTVVTPSSVPALLEKSERLLSALPADDLRIVIDEVATALEGRVETVRELGRDTAELSETLAAGIPEARRLIEESDELLVTLRDHRDTLARSISDSADVVETLAAVRPRTERILTDATPTAVLLDELIRDERANLACLNDDLLAVGELTAQPDNLREFERILDLNRFFYGGFDAGTQWDPFRPGVIWARVNILMSEEAGGQPKNPPTPTPPTLPGAACRTAAFGVGVDAVRQDAPQPPDETSPGIRYAPLVGGGADTAPDDDPPAGLVAAPTDPSAPALPADPSAPALPATGGGLLALGAALLGGALVADRARRRLP